MRNTPLLARFPSSLGVGVSVRDDIEPMLNFYLLDTHYTPTTSGFPTLFTNGVVAYGEYWLRTNWFELSGHSAIAFLYSSATRTFLDTNPELFLSTILAGSQPLTTKVAWTATNRLDQIIYTDFENPACRWTLNGDFGLTAGSPNPIRWFANLSLVGNGPIRSRENDTIGVGYYHLDLSNFPILTTHGIGAEDGVELFHNVAVTP